MSDAAAKSVGRPMKYPYTHAAKLAQFPYKHYWKNAWLVRYWCYSLVLCAPIFYKIGKLTNSPGNVASWEEKKRKEAEHHH